MGGNAIVSNEETPATILIAGGGIVGLALAMSIQKQLGVTPEIYEKASTFATEAGAGLGMYPNGLRVLRDISPDLLQAVRVVGYPYESRHWERHDGTSVSDAQESLLTDEEKDLDPIGIRRSKLQKVLYHFATAQDIPVHFKKPLESAVQRSDGLILVTFGDGTTRLTRVLFGADGALGKSRSIVAAGEEPNLKYTGVTCLMGLSQGKCRGIHFPSSNLDDFHAVFFPTGPNERCFQFHVPVAESDANTLNWGNLSQDVGQDECHRIAKQLREQGWHNKFIEPLESEHLIQAVRVGFALLEPRLKKWVRGRIALVGDAAHPPVPYIGQGAQQGLEDVGVAVMLLKLHCMNDDGEFEPTNFEKAMMVYQQIRIKRSSKILDFSKSLGQMQAYRANHSEQQAQMADIVVKGEVLMYGTLPIMMPGADHDYIEDVTQFMEIPEMPHLDEKATLDAAQHLFGFDLVKQMRDKLSIADTKQHCSFDLGPSFALTPSRIEALHKWLVEALEVYLRSILLHENSGAATISPEIHRQLEEYVKDISLLYRDSAYHNFEHSCNMVIAVTKFLSRMSKEKETMFTLDDRVIPESPLTLFAIVLATLFCHADHQGVSRSQLVKENPVLTRKYASKVPDKQYPLAVDLAFDLLTEPKYQDLYQMIHKGNDDDKGLHPFRKLVVHSILACDSSDQELKDFRKKRWEKTCHVNQRSTLAVETLIQVSDVYHALQPWQVFRRSNEKLYAEMYKVFKEGRTELDPTMLWFQGEVGFFDHYLLPLAKKLQKSHVFGTLGDECGAFAQENRQTLILQGPKIVKAMTHQAMAYELDCDTFR